MSAFGDVDQDGDLDLVLTGDIAGGTVEKYAILYTNDGSGTFTERATALVGTTEGSLDLFDADADGDLDVLLTGYGDAAFVIQRARLYKNTLP